MRTVAPDRLRWAPIASVDIPDSAARSTSVSRSVQRTGSGFDGDCHEFGVEHAPAVGDRSDRVGQGRRRRVLQENALDVRPERAQQVARLTEAGEDQRPARRKALE